LEIKKNDAYEGITHIHFSSSLHLSFALSFVFLFFLFSFLIIDNERECEIYIRVPPPSCIQRGIRKRDKLVAFFFGNILDLSPKLFLFMK
jgi:hypothetical protein